MEQYASIINHVWRLYEEVRKCSSHILNEKTEGTEISIICFDTEYLQPIHRLEEIFSK